VPSITRLPKDRVMGNCIERGARAPALLVTEQFPVACLMCCILSDEEVLAHKKITNSDCRDSEDGPKRQCFGAEEGQKQELTSRAGVLAAAQIE
jgi:hypothetical protein